MDPNRKYWNDQQKLLRQALTKSDDHQSAIGLFLCQHAMVHKAEMSRMGLHSFADEVWQDASEQVLRCIPPKFEHSIVWLIWHIARIEDMTMNGLLAERTQIFHQDDWLTRLNITIKHSGNVVMDNANMTELSHVIDIEALKAYRFAVGRSTRQAVESLRPEEFKHKVDPARLQELVENGSVIEEASDLLAYWGNLDEGGLTADAPYTA